MTDRSGNRLAPLDPAGMTDRQREFYDRVMAGRSDPPGTPLGGPHQAYVRSPELALRRSEMVQYLRKEGLLEDRLLELAVITIGRIWSAEVVFASHAPAAERAGISSEIIEAIRHRKVPDFEKADEAAVYNFVQTLATEYEVDDATYQAVLDVLGEAALVELIALAGSYVTTSMILNTFRIPVRAGMDRPYPDKQ